MLSQTYQDYEVIIIDDAGTEMVDLPLDSRIRYYRNDVNQGAEHGDRVHIKRFVEELASGEYFVYLCDDDYWLRDDLLDLMMVKFERHPKLCKAAWSFDIL